MIEVLHRERKRLQNDLQTIQFMVSELSMYWILRQILKLKPLQEIMVHQDGGLQIQAACFLNLEELHLGMI